MDYIRSCYRAVWQLPGHAPVAGHFIFAPDGTPTYPGYTYFNSANWHRGDGSDWPPFGEVEETARPWESGSFPYPYPLPLSFGQGDCIGSGVDGLLQPPAASLLWGVDTRCWAVLPAELAAGGLNYGGSSREAKAYTWGGLDLGGEADDGGDELAAGGLDLGGEADDGTEELAAGGLDLGGEATEVPWPARTPIGIATSTGATIAYTGVFVQPGDMIEVQWIRDGLNPVLIDWNGNGFTTVATTTLPGGGPDVGISRYVATGTGTGTVTVDPGAGANGLIAGAVKVTGLPSGTADGSATATGSAPDPTVSYSGPLTGPNDYVGAMMAAWAASGTPPSFGPVNAPFLAGQATTLTYGGNTYAFMEAYATLPGGYTPTVALTGSSLTDWAAATAAII